MANKIRFIKSVVDDKIVPQRLRKFELEDLLNKEEYMLHEGSYDYIIRIPVYNLTIDKVEDLEKEFSKAEQQYNDILNKDIKVTWKEELSDLAASLTSNCKSQAKTSAKKKLNIKHN
jgi:hypothetical protein